MERRINIACFEPGSKVAKVDDIWQWDYGQILRIQGLNLPTAVEIHFSLDEYGGEALRRIGLTQDGVTDVVIPDSMVENESAYGDSYYFFAYIYLSDEESGNTEYKIQAKVTTRSKPEGYNSGDSTFAAILKTVNEIADDKVTRPETAKVGQVLSVKATDEEGKPTEFEATDPGGGVSDEKIAEAVGTYMEAHPIEETDPTVPNWAKQPEKPTYTASEVGADAAGTAEGKVSAHNTSDMAHNDIRLLIEGLTTRLNALADSDDETLDQMSEVVACIKSNKSLIDAITTGKVSVSDIVDNLTTNVANKPLSAAQGVKLKALIDAITTVELDDSLTDNTKAAPAGMVGELKGDIEQLKQSGTGGNLTYGIYVGDTQPTNGVMYWLDTSGDGSEEPETIPATGITLDKTTLTFADSANQTLTATVEPSNSTDAITWESSNTEIATVLGGIVTPISNGSCTITAKAGNYSATCEVTVDVAEEIVTLSSISVVYTGGDVAIGTALDDLTGITVTATYSDGSTENVTDYSLSGEIVEGSNTITVSYGGLETTFTVVGVAYVEDSNLFNSENLVIEGYYSSPPDKDNLLWIAKGENSNYSLYAIPIKANTEYKFSVEYLYQYGSAQYFLDNAQLNKMTYDSKYWNLVPEDEYFAESFDKPNLSVSVSTVYPAISGTLYGGSASDKTDFGYEYGASGLMWENDGILIISPAERSSNFANFAFREVTA